jgi:hypothetical protein
VALICNSNNPGCLINTSERASDGALSNRSNGRAFLTHRDNGKRFVVRADEKSTAFLEVESAIRETSGKLLKEVVVEGRLSCDLNRAAKNISRLQNNHRV